MRKSKVLAGLAALGILASAGTAVYAEETVQPVVSILQENEGNAARTWKFSDTLPVFKMEEKQASSAKSYSVNTAAGTGTKTAISVIGLFGLIALAGTDFFGKNQN